MELKLAGKTHLPVTGAEVQTDIVLAGATLFMFVLTVVSFIGGLCNSFSSQRRRNYETWHTVQHCLMMGRF